MGKAGLLTRSGNNAFPTFVISQWLRVLLLLQNLQQRELLPTRTAFPFHRAENPSGLLANLAGANIEK